MNPPSKIQLAPDRGLEVHMHDDEELRVEIYDHHGGTTIYLTHQQARRVAFAILAVANPYEHTKTAPRGRQGPSLRIPLEPPTKD